MLNCCAVVLADSKMIMKEVLFKPMLNWVIDATRASGIENICIVAKDNYEDITTKIDDSLPVVKNITAAKDLIQDVGVENIIVLNGVTPLIDSDTIKGAVSAHIRDKNDITAVTTVSEKDNGFSCIFTQGAFFSVIDALGQGKAYSDLLTLRPERGVKVGTFIAQDFCSQSVADCFDLFEINELARYAVANKLMQNGVEIICIDGVTIGPDVRVGGGTKILQGTILRGDTIIGEGCTIGPNTLVENSVVGNNVVLNAVQCYQSVINDNVKAGPFVHIRPNSTIHSGVKIGDFVEVKNSVIGANTHIAHLTYVGDSDVGENVNFGCGCVTVNYDGQKKSRCTIGNNAFLGCNTNLIAPVKVGDSAYTAAGSTITTDVPAYALAVARERQVNIEGWVKRKRAKK